MDEPSDVEFPQHDREPANPSSYRYGNGDVRPPDRRRLAEDEAVRDALLRGGFDMASEADRRAFSDFLRWGAERREAAIQRGVSRQKAVIGIIGAIGVAILGLVSPAFIKALPASVQQWLK